MRLRKRRVERLSWRSGTVHARLRRKGKRRMDLDLDLDGKAAIITGTINPWGIGAATASAFAAESVKLV